MHGSSARYKNEDFQGLITWESLKQLYKKTIYDELMTHTWNITMQDVNHLVEGNQSNYNEEHKLYGSPQTMSRDRPINTKYRAAFAWNSLREDCNGTIQAFKVHVNSEKLIRNSISFENDGCMLNDTEVHFYYYSILSNL